MNWTGKTGLYSDPSDPSYKEKIEALLLETDNLANTNAEANAPNLDFKTKERHKRSASWDSSNKNIPSGQNPRGRKQPQPPLDAIEIGHNIQIHQMIHNSGEQPNVADYSGEQFQPSSWGNRQPEKSLYKQRRAGLNVAFLMEDRKKTSYLKKLSRKKRTPFKFEIRGYFSHDSSSSSESDESSEESEDDGRSMEDCSTESGDYATKEQDNRRDRNRGKASQWSGRQLMKKKMIGQIIRMTMIMMMMMTMMMKMTMTMTMKMTMMGIMIIMTMMGKIKPKAWTQ